MRHWLLLIPVLGIAAGATAGPAPPKKEPDSGPQIRFAGRQPAAGGAATLRFTLQPGTRDPGTVFAYLPGPEGQVPAGVLAPLYRIELQRDGKWVEHFLGWCGTGADHVKMAPGARLHFTLPVPKGDWQAMRAGVSWTPGTVAGAKPRTVWSDAVPRSAAVGKG